MQSPPKFSSVTVQSYSIGNTEPINNSWYSVDRLETRSLGPSYTVVQRSCHWSFVECWQCDLWCLTTFQQLLFSLLLQPGKLLTLSDLGREKGLCFYLREGWICSLCAWQYFSSQLQTSSSTVTLASLHCWSASSSKSNWGWCLYKRHLRVNLRVVFNQALFLLAAMKVSKYIAVEVLCFTVFQQPSVRLLRIRESHSHCGLVRPDQVCNWLTKHGKWSNKLNLMKSAKINKCFKKSVLVVRGQLMRFFSTWSFRWGLR